jgi:hypothetical protein
MDFLHGKNLTMPNLILQNNFSQHTYVECLELDINLHGAYVEYFTSRTGRQLFFRAFVLAIAKRKRALKQREGQNLEFAIFLRLEHHTGNPVLEPKANRQGVF